MRIMHLFILLLLITTQLFSNDSNKRIAYIVSDITIPFWEIMSNGMKDVAQKNNYELIIYNGENNPKKELEVTIRAIRDKVDGIILSPTNSSAAVTILKLAKASNIPVVISDIGADTEEYVSYISSDNFQGAYDIGKVLVEQMRLKNYTNGTVGILAIPQKRRNGQERTAGFMKALDQANIKGAGLKQFITWSDDESYRYVTQLIEEHPQLKAIWLQTSNMYKGALHALEDLGKTNEILLICFDAEPEFLELIPKGSILGSGMQQPFLMGETAASALIDHLNAEKVQKNIQLPILIVSTQNIAQKLPLIKRNVLGE